MSSRSSRWASAISARSRCRSSPVSFLFLFAIVFLLQHTSYRLELRIDSHERLHDQLEIAFVERRLVQSIGHRLDAAAPEPARQDGRNGPGAGIAARELSA